MLIPGAGGRASYWRPVAEELRDQGHDAVAVDLPAHDDSAGLAEYADAVIDAIGDATPSSGQDPLILVAQSMGGFTAPMVCQRLPVDLLILVNAMVPAPGEAPGDWWANTGHAQAMRDMAERDGRIIGEEFDLDVMFLHDLSPETKAALLAEGEHPQSGTPFEKPWPLPGWPAVPTRVLQGREDRFLPLESQCRVAQDRLGITPDEMVGGHLVALSHPTEVAERLIEYVTEL